MSLGQVFSSYEQRSAELVQQETWGHLAPKTDKVYEGYILYALGCYGDHCVLQVEFKDLDDSPWFYDHVNEFVSNMLDKKRAKNGMIFQGKSVVVNVE
jgi:hypothetical protein